MRPGIAAVLLLAFAVPAVAIERPAAVDAYLARLKAVEQATQPVSMEPLLAAASEVQDALMSLQPGGDQAWQETLPEADYAKLKDELRGLRLSRGYDVYAQPDGDFLLKLAQAHGRPQDRAFFALYQRFWNPQLLPQYLSIGKGTTPCVRFGEGIIPELYRDWSGFARQYPQAYTAFAQQTLLDLEEVIELGTCACRDADSVERELAGFVQKFPQSPAAPKARKRLAELKENPDWRPVHCR